MDFPSFSHFRIQELSLFALVLELLFATKKEKVSLCLFEFTTEKKIKISLGNSDTVEFLLAKIGLV